MKRFLAIVGAGIGAFMLVAMAQEWRVFAVWVLPQQAPKPALSAEDRAAAVATLHEYLAVANHVYASAADERFLERLPAEEEVVAELVADVAYLARNHRVQEPTLVRLEVTAVEPLGPRTVLVDTREYWTIRVLHASDRSASAPPYSQVVAVRYRVGRSGSRWRVQGWELAAPAPGGGR